MSGLDLFWLDLVKENALKNIFLDEEFAWFHKHHYLTCAG